MSLSENGIATKEPTQKNLMIFTGATVILVIAATVIFGLNVLGVAAVSLVVAFGIESAFAKVRKKEFDQGWMVTPLVFTLLLPPTAPWWMAAIGSSFGVFFGKAIFGGTGKTIFNPAAVGYLFLLFAFPNRMLTVWLNPVTNDIVSGATPLNALNRGIDFPWSIQDLLVGNILGSIGETFRIGIIVLGIVLIVLKVSDWKIPFTYISTVFVINFVGGYLAPDKFKDPVLSLLVGGLMLGAFFLATDPVTAPTYTKSKILYGVGLGVITVVIRNFATFAEGVVFAIIIMNALSPLIDSMKMNQQKGQVSV